MLKLNASYSKKVPAEGEYSSHSYHVAIELELPSNLTTNEMQDQIADTFRLCRESVEAELGAKNNVRQVGQVSPIGQKEQTKEPSRITHENEELASSRQVSFLCSLCKNKKLKFEEILSKYGVHNAYHLTKRQAIQIINKLKVA